MQSAAAAPEPMFVPPTVELPREPVSMAAKPDKPQRRTGSPEVELAIDDVTVKIARGADAKVIAAVIDASTA